MTAHIFDIDRRIRGPDLTVCQVKPSDIRGLKKMVLVDYLVPAYFTPKIKNQWKAEQAIGKEARRVFWEINKEEQIDDVVAGYDPQGYTTEQAVRMAHDLRRVAVSFKRISDRSRDDWRLICGALPCWTGTMTAYIEPDRTFREGSSHSRLLGGRVLAYKAVDGKRWLMLIPEEYLGEKNALLVMESPDYIIRNDGSDRIVEASRIDLVRNFPKANGYNPPDPVHGIPVNGPRTPTNVYFLERIQRRIGLVSFGHTEFSDDAGCSFCELESAYLNGDPPNKLGLVLETNYAEMVAADPSIRGKLKKGKNQFFGVHQFTSPNTPVESLPINVVLQLAR